ncbi:MAG: HAD-IIA family hydrolase [Anaerolineae bacterium]|nr:HAD-IIA family hydrolase [Anaerolineae bacterium]
MSATPSAKIEACIIDMDGVLWKQERPLINLSQLLDTLSRKGINFSFATNNATKTAQQYQEKVLRLFGIHIDTWRFITSAEATANYVLQHFPAGAKVYIIGTKELKEALAVNGFEHAETGHVVAVIAGLDPHLTYEKLRHATILIRNGVPFIGTNPDKTFPSPEGPIPGAGTILAALETASDVSPIIIGKPQPTMFKMAIERMGTEPHKTLVVGDRLDTDILGGINAKCKTALVLTGISTLQDIESCPYKPDFIGESIIHLFENV